KPDARVLGVIGSGGMARFFAPAIKAVRPIERVQAYSPNRARLEAYCAEMTAQLGCEVVPCGSANEVARSADVLSLCTNSQEPVIDPAHIRSGMHVTNVLTTELSPESFGRIEAVGLLARRTPMSMGGYV